MLLCSPALVMTVLWCLQPRMLVLQTALETVTPGGRVVQVGLGEDTCCVPTMQAVFKEVEFTGSWRYTNTVSQSLCLVAFNYDKHHIGGLSHG